MMQLNSEVVRSFINDNVCGQIAEVIGPQDDRSTIYKAIMSFIDKHHPSLSEDERWPLFVHVRCAMILIEICAMHREALGPDEVTALEAIGTFIANDVASRICTCKSAGCAHPDQCRRDCMNALSAFCASFIDPTTHRGESEEPNNPA